MSIKDSIGLRIKTERECQQMSREVLCLDGAELTVRQLIQMCIRDRLARVGDG